MTSDSTHARGTAFARMALAQALAKADGVRSAATFAESLWGPAATPTLALRSAVNAGSTVDGNPMATLAEYRTAAAEFIEALRPRTILGKLSGFRNAPLRTRIPRSVTGATAYWVGEGAPTPMSAGLLDTITMDAFKIGGIVASTVELAKLATPKAESVLRADLLAAVISLSDSSFIDPSRAGEPGVSPASIAYGAPTIAASGTTAAALRSDLRRLFAQIDTNLENPVLITDRRQAVALALMGDEFPGVTASGGMLAGVPLLTSSSVPSVGSGNSPADWQTSIVLLDAGELIVADDAAATIESSNQSDLEMNTAPDSPTTASTVRVSLWMHNMLAWRVTRYVNWEMARTGAVAVLTGANYGE